MDYGPYLCKGLATLLFWYLGEHEPVLINLLNYKKLISIYFVALYKAP